MGSLKDELHDNLENQFDIKFAQLLGITLNQLQMLEYETNEITNNDDYVTAVEYRFDDNSPKEILAKIKGLSSNNSITFDSGTLGY